MYYYELFCRVCIVHYNTLDVFFFFQGIKTLESEKKKKEVVAIYTRRNRFIKDGANPLPSQQLCIRAYSGGVCVCCPLLLYVLYMCSLFIKTVPEKAPRVVVASQQRDLWKNRRCKEGCGGFIKKKKKKFEIK